MPSQPFGGHPTLGQYCLWAVSGGCKVQHGICMDEDGYSERVTKITAPSGKWAIEVGTLDTEYLVPTTIRRLDNRLGLQSPFFSIANGPATLN